MSQNKSTEPPIRVLFVVERGDQCYPVEHFYSDFNQISQERFTIHHNTLAFIVPAQSTKCIRRLNREGDVIKVALYRPHDKKFSLNRFQFDYFAHENEECHFCSIMCRNSSGGLAEKKRARKDKRVRRTHHDSGESYTMSPHDSGYSLSPQGAESSYSPAAKRSREMSSSDEQSLPPPPVVQETVTPPLSLVDFNLMDQTVANVIGEFELDKGSTTQTFAPLVSGFADHHPGGFDYFDDLLASTTDGGPAGQVDPGEDDIGVETFDTLVLPDMDDEEASEDEIEFDPKRDVQDHLEEDCEGPEEKERFEDATDKIQEEEEEEVQQLCDRLHESNLGQKEEDNSSSSRSSLLAAGKSSPSWIVPFLLGIGLILVYEILARSTMISAD